MNESYKQLLVKKERDMKQTLLRVACVIPTVVCAAFTLLTGQIVMFIFLIVCGVLDYFVFQWTDIEYEYLYVDREISIDKILAKTRRKKIATIEKDKIEIMEPEKSHKLDYSRNKKENQTAYSAAKE